MVIAGCGDSNGTEQQTDCPPSVVVTEPPVIVGDGDLKQRTVQITLIDEHGLPRERGLGTVINGGYTIVTHNHYKHEHASKEVEISDHRGIKITTLHKSDITSSLYNYQTKHMDLPQMIVGIEGTSVAIAAIGDASALEVGDAVSTVYRTDGGRIEILHKAIDHIRTPGEVEPHVPVGMSVIAAHMSNEEGIIKSGDSGGGLFHDGKLVGNTWYLAELTKDSVMTPIFTSALYLP
jgi:hypothetical protein